MKYTVRYSDDAILDFNDISHLIANEFGMPKTAFNYLKGLKEKIKRLEHYPEMCAVSNKKFVIENYGFNVRQLNYKKVSVIYTIIGKDVWIMRVLWSYSIK